MATVTLVGLQPLDFDTEDGSRIKGINLYLNYPDENVYGKKADKKFISHVTCSNLGIDCESLLDHIDQEIELETNLKGKVIGIKTIKPITSHE